MMNWMTETYRKNTAADEYWFGFILAGMVYVVCGLTLDELLTLCRMDRASTAKGGFKKIRIRAKVDALKALLPRSILLGDESILMDDRYNKGDMFEKAIVERFTGEQWVKNSVPFFMAGDVTIDGKQVQVKFNGAELTNEKILRCYFPA